MKKITQNLTNVKVWQSIMFAFIFLLSLTLFSQTDATKLAEATVVGDQLIENVMLQTTSMNKSIVESIPWSDDFETGTLANWTSSAATGAPASLWEASSLQNNTSGGAYSARHNYSSAGTFDSYLVGPTFDLSGATSPIVSYSDQVDWSGDADVHSLVYSEDYTGDVDAATWVVLNDVLGTEDTWVANGPYTLPTTGTVTIAFRYQGYYAAEWFVDDVSVEEAPVTIPWSDDFETGTLDNWTSSAATGAPASLWEASSLQNNTSGGAYSARHNYSSAGTFDSYMIGPTFDLSGATSPIVSYSDQVDWSGDADVHSLVYSEDYTGDVDAATWVVLNDVLGTEDTWVENGPYSLPTTSAVTVAFRYQGYYAAEWFVDDVSIAEAPVGAGADWDVSAANLSDSATVSITTTNFTVADGTADGHWHYTLDGGSAVMVYDTNDVTLTGLSSGSHTLFAMLVDNSHAALSPAVEETITWTQTAPPGCGESLSYDYTTGSSGGSGFDTSFTGPDAADLLFTSTVDNTGDAITVTLGGTTENNYDWVYVTDGAGNVLQAPISGTMGDVDVTSTDGTVNVYLASDSSVTSGPVTFTVTCASSQSTVTFNVDMANYPGGLASGDTVWVNGDFTGWCGDCGWNQMTDTDGDGIYTLALDFDDGDYLYKITINGWAAQESWPVGQGPSCTADDGSYVNRAFTVAGSDMSLDHYWNLCPGDTWSALILQGIIDFDVPSAGSDGKAIHVYAQGDIADLSVYGIGVANNGGGTDGQEYTFPAQSATAGDHILVVRSVSAMDAYMDASNTWTTVLQGTSDISQNGDDAIELFKDGAVVETFGDIDVDGTGESWDYVDSWAYKVNDAWTYGGINCTDGSTTTCDSSCPYPFAACPNTELITFLSTGVWRYQYEVAGYRGVGSGTATWAEWWSSAEWEDMHSTAWPNPNEVNHGLIDDTMSFGDDGSFIFETGPDGAIMGKKPEIDPAFDPNGTNAYAADNTYNEYWTYPLADFTDTYTVGPASNETITFATVGALGFYTALAGQEYQILSRDATTMYVRNVGSEGNSWYSMLTTDAHFYASTDDAQILEMMIYPNPVDGNFVTIISPVNGLKNIEVFDINGRRVMDTVINNNTLDVSSINSGFYMIKVTIGGQSKISKLVVR